MFGLSALVPPYLRRMSAISKGSSRVVCVSGNELRTLFDNEPRLGYEVLNALLKSDCVEGLEYCTIDGNKEEVAFHLRSKKSASTP